MAGKNREEIRDQIRSRGEFDDDFVADATLNEWINDSIAALHDLEIEADPDRHLDTDAISVVSGTRSYSLPSDFYRLYGVEIADSSWPNGFRSLGRYMHRERNSYVYSSKWDTRYRYRGGKLWLHPEPNWSATAPADGSLQVNYIAEAFEFTDDITDHDTPNNVIEWVILDCLIKCGDLDEQNVSGWVRRQSSIEKRILSQGPVDIGEPKTVVRTSARNRFSRNPRHRMIRTP
jgi:hypothetical protein